LSNKPLCQLAPALSADVDLIYPSFQQITLNAQESKDVDFKSVMDASPTFYWLCRNSSEPEFKTSGNVTDIDVVSIPELDGIHNISEVNLICFSCYFLD